MDEDLYRAIQLLFEDVKVPESTDKACEQMIQKYIQKEKDRKGEEDDKVDIEVDEEAESTEDSTQSETPENIQSESVQSTVTKTTMYAKSSVNVRSGAGTSNAQIGSLSKGQEVVKIGEENGWSKIEFGSGIGYVSSKYLTLEKVEANNTSNNNNQTSSGTGSNTPSTSTPEPEKSPYAGMYHERDEASFQRVAKCADILRGGLAGFQMRYHEEYGTIDYFSSLSIANCTTIGAWMYIVIGHWTQSADNVAGCETEPAYREIPTLTKQCFEAIAPEGGTELYNTINSLIMQYGGPSEVPIQGVISESILGLYVEIRENGPGLTIIFWAE